MSKSLDMSSQLDTLYWLESTLHDMLRGKKPVIDVSEPTQNFLFQQMRQMYQEGFLMEPPRSYCILDDELDLAPEDMERVMKLKGVTRREPIPKTLTTEARRTRCKLEENEISNARILGEDPSFLYRRKASEQLDYADSFILTQAGLAGLYQFVHYLRCAQEGKFTKDLKHVVLQDSESYWDPVVNTLSDIIENTPGFKITSSRHDTSEYLDTALGERKFMPAKQSEDTPHMQPGHIILPLTTNIKKENNFRKAADLRSDGVNIRNYHSLLRFRPNAAEEFSYSYIGNIIEKFYAFYELLQGLGTQIFRDQLDKNGWRSNQISILIEDQGLEMDGDLFKGPEFNNCITERENRYREYGPGPELKGIISSVASNPFKNMTGDRALVERVFSARDRIHEGTPPEDMPDIKARQKSCAMIIPLDRIMQCVDQGMDVDQAFEQDIFTLIHSETRNTLLREPPEEKPALDLPHFLVPDKDPDGYTQAQTNNYEARFGLPGNNYKAIARTHGFGDRRDDRFSLKHRFQSMDLDDKKIGSFEFPDDISRKRYEVKTKDGQTIEMDSALQCFYEYCLRHDGFFVQETNLKRDLWKDLFQITSLLVGAQLKDSSILGKPIVWRTGEIHSILEKFSSWLIKEKLEELCKPIGHIREKDEAFKSEFFRLDAAEPEHHSLERGGQEAPEDLFRVTVYCSATSTDADMKKQASDFGLDLSALGFAVKTGGGTGTDGLMVEVNKGVVDRQKDFVNFLRSLRVSDDVLPQTHLSCHHSTETADEEGFFERADFYDILPTIYYRMDRLQDTDAEVILPGGAGTIQEIAASAIMRKSGLMPVEHRPMIIVNHNNMYDELIDLMPKADFKELNIHVVDTLDEALHILSDARQNRNMTPDLPYADLDAYKSLKAQYVRSLCPANTNEAVEEFTMPVANS